MKKYQKIIYRDINDIDKYDFIRKEEFFKEKDNKDIFIFAMAFGFQNNIEMKINKRDEAGFIRTEYLDEYDWTLIKSVAIDKKGIEVLDQPEQVIEIAENYAHGGIQQLCRQIENLQFGSLEKWIE